MIQTVRQQGTNRVLVLGEQRHDYLFTEGETEELMGLTAVTQLSMWYQKPGLTGGA